MTSATGDLFHSISQSILLLIIIVLLYLKGYSSLSLRLLSPINVPSFSLMDCNWGRSKHRFFISVLPINENDCTSMKQFWLISMDWRDGRFDISNDVAFWNTLSLNWRRPIHQFTILPNHSIQMTAPYWNSYYHIWMIGWKCGSIFQMTQC